MPLCSAETLEGGRCHRISNTGNKCWQHAGGPQKSNNKKGRFLNKKETIYMMRGLIRSYHNGQIEKLGSGKTKLITNDSKLLDLVENLLIAQGGKFTRKSNKELIIVKLPERSYISLGIEGQYVIWMEPHLKDIFN